MPKTQSKQDYNAPPEASNLTVSTSITESVFYPKSKSKDKRGFALLYFAFLLTFWNVLGHSILGFEQALLQPMLAVSTAVLMQFLLEYLDAKDNERKPRYEGSLYNLAVFITPAWISGLAIGMLLLPNKDYLVIVFASALSIASKGLFRAPVQNGSQHIFNPSNFGITITLLLFPWIGVAPPYQFVENVTGIWHWIIPATILACGLFIHSMATSRLILIGSFLSGFVLQAFLRHIFLGISLLTPLAPMTSAAFLIFTLFMIPDPATTPLKPFRQIAFGFSIAAIYGILQIMHLFFGLFIALFIVTAIRGSWLFFEHLSHKRMAHF